MASFERSGHGYDSGFGQQAGNFSSGADEYGSGGNYSESTNDGYNRQMPKVEGQLVKVFCEARPEYYVTVNGNHVGLASGNDSNKRQQFVKDSRWSNRVKDSSGSPAFALVHQETGLALKHGNDLYDKVSLQEYDPNTLDESVLWTQSNDVGGGYQCLRPVGNIHLNLDASHGDEGHGGSVSEGTELILFEWKKQENQKWKMIPISSEESQNYGGEAGYGGGGSHGEGYGGGRDGAGYGGGRGGEGYGGGRDGEGYGGGRGGEGYGGGRDGEGYGGGRNGAGYGSGRDGEGYGGERRYGGGYGGNNEY